MGAADSLPDDLETLKQLVRAREAELARARAEASSAEALILHLRLTIEKMRREIYGPRSERKARLLDQMEFQLEELEASAAEDDLAAEKTAESAGETTTVRAFTRKKPARKPFPAHLPRERVIVPGPSACACCGSTKLAKLGEDVTETLESVPRQWKVVQYVREKFTCRECEKITQAPAPFHVLPRGFAGPSLLAMILFEKYGQHQPLNRQSARYAREGIDLSSSTLADQVGGCAMLVRPLYELIRAHVFAASRVHGETPPCRYWPKGRQRPGGPGSMFAMIGRSAAVIRRPRCSSTRAIVPASIRSVICRAMAGSFRRMYAGFNQLYAADRSPGPITEAACWSHSRRKFFVLADVTAKARGKLAVIAPLAFEAVKRIDAIFDVEREINGLSADERLAVRTTRIAPLVSALEAWMRAERAKLSRHSDVAKAMDYMLKRWDSFTRFLADGRICLTNNAAERELRGIALGRKSWLFAGSDRGGERAAVMYTLIQTARLNDVNPQAWLADVLERINDHNIQNLDQLLPWNWKAYSAKLAA